MGGHASTTSRTRTAKENGENLHLAAPQYSTQRQPLAAAARLASRRRSRRCYSAAAAAGGKCDAPPPIFISSCSSNIANFSCAAVLTAEDNAGEKGLAASILRDCASRQRHRARRRAAAAAARTRRRRHGGGTPAKTIAADEPSPCADANARLARRRPHPLAQPPPRHGGHRDGERDAAAIAAAATASKGSAGRSGGRHHLFGGSARIGRDKHERICKRAIERIVICIAYVRTETSPAHLTLDAHQSAESLDAQQILDKRP